MSANRIAKLLGKHAGDPQMWKDCKVDFASTSSTAMHNLRVNTNAVKFLAGGRWRRWIKDLPPGGPGVGRVSMT